MKRIMLSVFAAAITAAWVVPASAADVSFSGQYRLRGEFRNQADFSEAATDNTSFYGQRVRVTANAQATDDTTVKVTLQDTRNWGATQNATGGPGLTDTGNTLDLHESYVNINNLFGAPLALRAGRQELAYGDERLVGAFNWSNNGRSFDALKLMYTHDLANVDFWTSKVRENTTTDNDQDFYGLYSTIKAIPNIGLDLYVLLLRDGGTTAFGTNNTTIVGSIDEVQSLWTYGARVKGAVAGLDYTVEIPFQTGDINTTGTDYNIQSWAFAAKLGYTLPTPLKVRLGAEYDYAKGDDNAGDNDIDTFFNLFPTNHDKLGYMDQQAWRNVKAWNLNASADVNEKVKLVVSFWDFSLAEDQDAWYSAGSWMNAQTGTARAANATSDEGHVGSELDIVATYKYNKAVTAEVGIGRFFSGKFVEDAVGSTNQEDQDWAYLMLTANF